LKIEKGIEDDIFFKNYRSFTIITISILFVVRPTVGECGIASASSCSEKREAHTKTIPV
jgi:hypothetical protein